VEVGLSFICFIYIYIYREREREKEREREGERERASEPNQTEPQTPNARWKRQDVMEMVLERTVSRVQGQQSSSPELLSGLLICCPALIDLLTNQRRGPSRWKRKDVMEKVLERTWVKGEKKKRAIQKVEYSGHDCLIFRP